MKPGLRRIEATLKQMIEQPVSLSDPPMADRRPISFTLSPSTTRTDADSAPGSTSKIHLPLTSTVPAPQPPEPKGDRPASSPFLSVTRTSPASPVQPSLPASTAVSESTEATVSAPAPSVGVPSLKVPISRLPNSAPATAATEKPLVIPGEAVRPFAVQDSVIKGLGLPKFKLPNFSSSRYVTNPEFVVGLLNELTSIVSQWQKELQQVSLKIQDLYLEGPVIDGWLESQTAESPPATSGIATIRHAEIEQLMEYVEEICKGSVPSDPSTPRTGYRLCGLDADGQLWSRPCASEKVPEVSLAIARYQKLRQLLAQKAQLEGRLDQFARALIDLHSSIPTD